MDSGRHLPRPANGQGTAQGPLRGQRDRADRSGAYGAHRCGQAVCEPTGLDADSTSTIDRCPQRGIGDIETLRYRDD